METHRNILGAALQCCCLDPLTGFYRDGHCRTGVADTGSHVICAQITQEFLEFTLHRGNDLRTPRPELRFPGLKPGDKWCLCAIRWREALDAGVAPPVYLDATHERALEFVTMEQLQAHGLSLTTHAE
jgi:uncharacterized protein (DUF2237 family)